MELTTIIIILLCCIGASFVQRVSGFGFGIFIMTMLPYLMPSYGEATTLSGTLAAAQSLWVVIKLRNFISWKRLLPILITFLITSFISVQYVAIASDNHLKHILGAILILMSIYFLIFSEKIHLRTSLGMQISMGALSGTMGGLFAMQGPPAILYFVASEPTKENYLAMTQAYFVIGNIAMTIFRASNGFLTPAVCYSWLYAVVGIFIGTWLGKKVFDRISALILRKIIYAYMAVSGIIALFS